MEPPHCFLAVSALAILHILFAREFTKPTGNTNTEHFRRIERPSSHGIPFWARLFARTITNSSLFEMPFSAQSWADGIGFSLQQLLWCLARWPCRISTIQFRFFNSWRQSETDGNVLWFIGLHNRYIGTRGVVTSICYSDTERSRSLRDKFLAYFWTYWLSNRKSP